MGMHDEKVDFLFEATRCNILHGLAPREAFESAIEDTLDIFFSDEIERAKEEKYEKKLIDMTDAELKQACDEDRARLHLSENTLKTRMKKDAGGTD